MPQPFFHFGSTDLKMVDRTVYADKDHIPDLPLRQIFGRQRVAPALCLEVANAGLLTVETFSMLGNTIAAVKNTIRTVLPSSAQMALPKSSP